MATLRAGALLARRYRLIDPIGAGGMSIIWRARDELLDRMVAIKVLASELAADARFRALVREEARAAAQLVHPHVTAVHDYGETVGDDGSITAFVVMELLTGEELEARLTAGPLPWQEAIEVCAQVAEALAAAHRLGIVHRDVTPANIMLTANGAKVLDFGIATHIGAPDEDEDGDTFGTPAYVAPERLDGVPAQPATDTYSLGVLLFETLSGHVPFPAETWDDLARSAPGGQMPPLEVPGLPVRVAETCQRCLSRDPRERPSASLVGEVLREQLLPTDPYANTMLTVVPAVPHARYATDAAGVALATSAAGTATLIGGPPGVLTAPVGYGWAGAGPPSDPTGGGTAVAPGGGPPGGWAPPGSWPPAGPWTPIGPWTPTGPGTPPGPGRPGIPRAPGTWDGTEPPARSIPRRAWSPLRAGLAATGSVAALTAALLIGLNLGNGSAQPGGLTDDGSARQVVPTPGPVATLGPGGSAGAGAAPSRPPGRAPVRTVREAVRDLTDVIDDGLAGGGIRRDAGLDLQQMVNNLRIDIAAGSADVDGAASMLRQKVDTRANEGAISSAYASRLKAALDALEDAR